MAAITEWIRRIIAYLIFTTTISNILREQTYQKYVKLVCGIILIFLLAEPLFAILNQEGTYQFHLSHYFLLDQVYDTTAIENAGKRKNEFLLRELKTSIENELMKIADRYELKINKTSIHLCEDRDNSDYGKVQNIELILKHDNSIYQYDFDSPNIIQMRNEIAESFYLPIDRLNITIR